VRLTVSVAGGVLNRDRVLSVDDHELRVAEDGEVRAHRRLARADVDHLRDLATRVVGLDLPPSKPGEYAVDGGTTTIEIAEPVNQRIVLSAGDDAPEPVWALLDAVKALSRPDGEQAESGRAGL
jgi:hypothetical protein